MDDVALVGWRELDLNSLPLYGLGVVQQKVQSPSLGLYTPTLLEDLISKSRDRRILSNPILYPPPVWHRVIADRQRLERGELLSRLPLRTPYHARAPRVYRGSARALTRHSSCRIYESGAPGEAPSWGFFDAFQASSSPQGSEKGLLLSPRTSWSPFGNEPCGDHRAGGTKLAGQVYLEGDIAGRRVTAHQIWLESQGDRTEGLPHSATL